MHKKERPKQLDVVRILKQFPHCDVRILHAPSECKYCDAHPDWQALRQAWGIAFTGYEPDEKELPCPAEHARPRDVVNRWGGNRARPAASAPSAGETCPACSMSARNLGAAVHNLLVRLDGGDWCNAGSKLHDLKRAVEDTMSIAEPAELVELRNAAWLLVDAAFRNDGATPWLVRTAAHVDRLRAAKDAWQPVVDRHFADRKHSHRTEL